jgi:hypothetical protein
MLGKITKIRADLSENMLKSGYFITILHKNSGKLSTAPPRKTSVPFSYVVLENNLRIGDSHADFSFGSN